MFCQSCGAQSAENAKFCAKCGKALPPAKPRALFQPPLPPGGPGPPMKSPGVAAVLSFFYVGLGQIYNGQIAKGIIFMCLFPVSALLMFVFIGFITTPIFWIYGMIDAYDTAEQINQNARYNYR